MTQNKTRQKINRGTTSHRLVILLGLSKHTIQARPTFELAFSEAVFLYPPFKPNSSTGYLHKLSPLTHMPRPPNSGKAPHVTVLGGCRVATGRRPFPSPAPSGPQLSWSRGPLSAPAAPLPSETLRCRGPEPATPCLLSPLSLVPLFCPCAGSSRSACPLHVGDPRLGPGPVLLSLSLFFRG